MRDNPGNDRPPRPDGAFECPIPIRRYPRILAAHGGGGRLMHDLIEQLFLTAFQSDTLRSRHDGMVMPSPPGRLAFTTDSYVINPLFFPGGDIGSLAVYGTVNDLAMCGARPIALSAGFILEEGLEVEALWRIARSMKRAADEAGVTIVTGDTKVVERGKGDGVFINTAGVGAVECDLTVGPQAVRADDAILVSGDVGRHGIAIMAVREGLEFETPLESDCAPLASRVMALLDAGLTLHCMRDLTRGGLATALIEIAEGSAVSIRIDERRVAVAPEVRGACEILGLDPLYVANEGRFVAFVPPEQADAALGVLRGFPGGADAQLIGKVTHSSRPGVTMTNRLGTRRILDMLSGEQLPRIC